MKVLKLVPVLALMGLATACQGVPLQTDSPVQSGETVIGEVEGSSTGIMLLGFIPIGQNQRFQVAYDRALAGAPGATRLANVRISENWFWAYVLNGYSTTIHGTAVKR
ncbi:MAG: hypothetical protein K8T90_00745 [Planctomycetes bacterium]|nr:hypothetical protein [Planctomycetota bacterium]